MAIQNNFPAIKPTLLLDFANTEQLDPRITFARASTATYYGTETAKAEENLLLRSQELTFGGVWFPAGLTAAANTLDTTAPDGSSTATKLILTASTSVHQISHLGTTTISSTYTYSVFAKKGTQDFVQLKVGNNAGAGFVNFDLNLGTLSATTATGTITDVGNGWYRCTMTAAVTVTIGYLEVNVVTSLAAARSEIWTSVGTESVYLWGAQLEQRSAVTAYAPTTTQPITNYIPVLETAASGVARFDHNPTTFESLGLLIEEQRTNLLTYSDDLADAAWVKFGLTVGSNVIVAPDGALIGDSLIEDTANTNKHIRAVSVSLTSGVSYTLSAYVKPNNCDVIAFREGAVSGDAITIKFSTNTGSLFGTRWGSLTIANVGNGWYRVSAVFTPTSSASHNFRFHLLGNEYSQAINTSPGTYTYTGNGFSGIYIWGAQLEAGAFPTSYIPTTTAQVTRAADAASMTGANFSSWYNAAEGSIVAGFGVNQVPSVDARLFYIGDGTTSNLMESNLTSAANVVRFNVSTGGASQAAISTAVTAAQGGPNWAAATYKVNDFAATANGAAAVADTVGTVPVSNQLVIGNYAGLSRHINGTIRKLAYYPVRVTNAALQALTS